MKVGFPARSSDAHLPRSGQAYSSLLRAGDRISLYVERRVGQVLVIRVGSQLIRARLNGDVHPGNWYRATVVRPGPTLILRTTDSHPVPLDSAALARSHGLPAGAEAVIRAFVRSGLPLHGERLALAWRRVRTSSHLTTAERARIAAVLEEKGLLDSPPAFDRAIEAAGGAHEERQRHRPSDRNVSAQESEREPAETAETVEDAPLADSVRLAFEHANENTDLLQLINHRAGREANWIIVPLEFADEPHFSASVKLRMPLATRDLPNTDRGFVEAILDIRDEDRRWTFGIRPVEAAGGSIRVTLLAAPSQVGGNEDELRALFSPLRERLKALETLFDLRPMSKDSNDGFSHDEGESIIRRVESSA